MSHDFSLKFFSQHFILVILSNFTVCYHIVSANFIIFLIKCTGLLPHVACIIWVYKLFSLLLLFLFSYLTKVICQHSFNLQFCNVLSVNFALGDISPPPKWDIGLYFHNNNISYNSYLIWNIGLVLEERGVISFAEGLNKCSEPLWDNNYVFLYINLCKISKVEFSKNMLETVGLPLYK